jgi:hypothetical protein
MAITDIEIRKANARNTAYRIADGMIEAVHSTSTRAKKAAPEAFSNSGADRG